MASIQTEGSMVVRETRTYDFDGDFTFAYRDFPESPEWEYSDITILEDGVALRTATPADLEPAKTPGTYYLADLGGTTRATWFFRASDERRTFAINYRVTGAVKAFTG